MVEGPGVGNGRRDDRQRRHFGLRRQCIECRQRGRDRGRETRTYRAFGPVTVLFVICATAMMVMPGMPGICAPGFKILDEFGL